VKQDPRTDAVVAFYDTHPINERQILDKLDRDGVDPAALTQDILQAYDQDHYGGVAANDALAAAARIDKDCHVLDVCCGMGGPARYLAHTHGCRVTGIDLAESRIEGARRLTRMAGLDGQVTLRTGNALDLPFADASFDVVISQEAFCHIPDKVRLIGQCARVLKPGGRMAFTDILITDTTRAETLARLEREMAFRDLGSVQTYREAFEQAGCPDWEVEDLGAEWRDILMERLAMYRSLRDQTIERFGEAHYARWDQAYGFFVGLYETGELGGGRFLVRR